MNYSTPMLSPEDWCGAVALLCAPSMLASATDTMLGMLPLLQRRFPPHLFTEETAEAVALAPRKLAIPAYDEVAAALRQYRATFIYEPRPALPAPAEPERKTPSQEEAEAVTRSVAQALQVIAEEGARMRDDTAMHLRPRAATASGEGLHQLRKQRFADLVAAGKMQPHEVPEHYR